MHDKGVFDCSTDLIYVELMNDFCLNPLRECASYSRTKKKKKKKKKEKKRKEKKKNHILYKFESAL